MRQHKQRKTNKSTVPTTTAKMAYHVRLLALSLVDNSGGWARAVVETPNGGRRKLEKKCGGERPKKQARVGC